MALTIVVGVDLGGPTRVEHTAAVVLGYDKVAGNLTFVREHTPCSDGALYEMACAFKDEGLVVGLDAPLSYEPGGGDRSRDAALRAALRPYGMTSSVMSPTMTRMSYLTLRGVSVARLMGAGAPKARVCEVHPGAACVLRGLDPTVAKGWKRGREARIHTLGWLEQWVKALPHDRLAASDHLTAATGAAVAAWSWAHAKPAFIVPPEPPWHPFALVA